MGFVHDIAAATVAKHIHQIETVTNEAIVKIKDWIGAAYLELWPTKRKQY